MVECLSHIVVVKQMVVISWINPEYFFPIFVCSVTSVIYLFCYIIINFEIFKILLRISFMFKTTKKMKKKIICIIKEVGKIAY